MDDVQKLVDENPYLEIFHDDSGKEKVKCKLTGHQLPCRLPDVLTYTKGKKYQRLLKGLAVNDKGHKETDGHSLDKYKQYLVPAEKNRNQLYCKVTKKLINDIPYHMELHVKGKRFQKALKTYEENKSNETPNEGEDEFNVWEPSDKESSEPDIDPLPDSFGEESDEDEEKGEDNDDDGDDEDDVYEQDKKKESNSNKRNKQSNKKTKGIKNTNTRKRNLTEEASEQKRTLKKVKKQSKSRVPLRKNHRRKAKK